MKKIWACWYAVELSPQHIICVRDTQCDDQKTCKKNVHTASNLTRYVCMPRCMRKKQKGERKKKQTDKPNYAIHAIMQTMILTPFFKLTPLEKGKVKKTELLTLLKTKLSEKKDL